jgi:hypothetical protein
MITINVNLTESLEKLLLSALRQAEAPAESEAPGRDEALLGPANEEPDKRPAPLNGLTYETKVLDFSIGRCESSVRLLLLNQNEWERKI